MAGKIKQKLDETQSKVTHFIDEIEHEAKELAEDLNEGSLELFHDFKQKLNKFKHSLQDSSNKFATHADEAQLQAHLAAMDAHDQWLHLNSSINYYNDRLRGKIKPGIEHAEIQAALAKMEARDFLSESSHAIEHEFNQSRSELEQKTMKLATDIHEYFAGIIDGLPK